MNAYINTNKLLFDFLNNRNGLKVFSNMCDHYDKIVDYNIDRVINRMSKKYNACTIVKAFNRLNLLVNIKLYNRLKDRKDRKKLYKRNQFKILKTRIYGVNTADNYIRKYKGIVKRNK